MTRRSVCVGAGVLLGAVAVCVSAVLWINSPPSDSRGGLVEIPAGARARVIARRLHTAGHVRSSLWLEILARSLRADQKLKAGAYRIPAHQRADRILRSLILGRGATVRVTIPEGFAVWQMAARLNALGICHSMDFLTEATPWEGFLFPDTYFFDPGSSPKEIVRTMRERFIAEWKKVFQEHVGENSLTPVIIGGAPMFTNDLSVVPGAKGVVDVPFHLKNGLRLTVRQAVTLASLIERETSRSEERPQVSAVYHNRLKKGMRLECDPTVQYALGAWKSPLYKKNLTLDSPYNTYRHFGLPPGPIASPGRDSLAAALAPAHVDFLYFVSDGAGGHQFSSTYEDHQNAVRQYRRTVRGRSP